MTTVCVDVSDIEATKKEVGNQAPIHLLVNNAGVTELQPFLEVTPQAYDKYGCRQTFEKGREGYVRRAIDFVAIRPW